MEAAPYRDLFGDVEVPVIAAYGADHCIRRSR